MLQSLEDPELDSFQVAWMGALAAVSLPKCSALSRLGRFQLNLSRWFARSKGGVPDLRGYHVRLEGSCVALLGCVILVSGS